MHLYEKSNTIQVKALFSTSSFKTFNIFSISHEEIGRRVRKCDWGNLSLLLGFFLNPSFFFYKAFSFLCISIKMTSSDKDGQGMPLVVFVPIILCVVGILVLLDIRQRQRNPQYGN
jgi:hypothetical protein